MASQNLCVVCRILMQHILNHNVSFFVAVGGKSRLGTQLSRTEYFESVSLGYRDIEKCNAEGGSDYVLLHQISLAGGLPRLLSSIRALLEPYGQMNSRIIS